MTTPSTPGEGEKSNPMSDEALTQAEIEELRAKEAAASKGPWRHGYSDGSGRVDPSRDEGGTICAGLGDSATRVVAGGRDSWGCEVGVITEADADFIAAARNALPRLLAKLDEAAKLLDDACESLNLEGVGEELQERVRRWRPLSPPPG